MKQYPSKTVNSLEEAASYQNKLYEKYNSVKIVMFPRFHPAGAGKYVWEVIE